MSIYSNQEYAEATIASGASVSGTVNIGQRMLIGLVMPAAWTTANLTFQHALSSSGTFLDAYNQFGAEVLIPASASRYITLRPQDFAGWQSLRIRSGTSATPVNQGAARVIGLIFRAF